MKRTLPTVGLALLALILTASIIGPALSPHGVGELTAQRLSPPSAQHWLGTDLHKIGRAHV